MVYENYTKFISATDLSQAINKSLSSDEVTNDLESMKDHLKSMTVTHQTIENSLKLKLKQIKKLDVLQTDLNKLRHLSELPEMFKSAIDTYSSCKKVAKSGSMHTLSDEEPNISEIFGKTL